MGEQAITPEAVRRVAKLARLALDEQHVQKYAAQLQPILGYIDQLQTPDLSGVEPMAHAFPLTNVLREDVAAPGLSLDEVLRNAPETDGPYFKVPKVLGGGEDSAG